MGLFKPIVTFYEFTNWYKEKYKPHVKDPLKIKQQYIEADELVEVTPNFIRMRKRWLTENERKKNS